MRPAWCSCRSSPKIHLHCQWFSVIKMPYFRNIWQYFFYYCPVNILSVSGFITAKYNWLYMILNNYTSLKLYVYFVLTLFSRSLFKLCSWIFGCGVSLCTLPYLRQGIRPPIFVPARESDWCNLIFFSLACELQGLPPSRINDFHCFALGKNYRKRRLWMDL